MKFKNILTSLIDLIYPRPCVGCAAVALASPNLFCMSCASSLPYTHFTDVKNNDFEKHFLGRIHLQAGTALFHFSKKGFIQHAIHQLKYKNQPQVGFELGKMLGRSIREHPNYSSCDMVIGVPLHRKKKWKRGYNQADFIAHGVADVLGISYDTTTVVRNRHTTSQTRKSRINRMANMDGGFHIKNVNRLQGKHVLLVDDVMTSGATLDYCGQAILRVPDTQLSMATLAMGSVV